MNDLRDFRRTAASVRTGCDQISPILLSRRAVALGGLALTAGLYPSPGRAWDGPLMDVVEGSEDFVIASDAYIYGYPLVTMEMTRRVVTNVVKPEGTRAPMGTLIKLREYPNASFRDVTAPNADTLYTTAMLDAGDEPWVLSSPDMRGRYFLLPCLSGWTDVFQVPGSRTTGTKAQTFLITGPGWSGTVPAGMSQLKSPTALVWMLGRIYCTGTPQDYAEVHALQDQFKLQPLSTWGKEYVPPPGKVDPSIDMKMAVREQVNRLSATEYFALLADLLKRNPPAPADAPALKRFERIGLVRGKATTRRLATAIGTSGCRSSRMIGSCYTSSQGWRLCEGERLGIHHQSRRLRHQLSPARIGDRHRAWGQSSAGRRLSNLHEAFAVGGL